MHQFPLLKKNAGCFGFLCSTLKAGLHAAAPLELCQCHELMCEPGTLFGSQQPALSSKKYAEELPANSALVNPC